MALPATRKPGDPTRTACGRCPGPLGGSLRSRREWRALYVVAGRYLWCPRRSERRRGRLRGTGAQVVLWPGEAPPQRCPGSHAASGSRPSGDTPDDLAVIVGGGTHRQPDEGGQQDTCQRRGAHQRAEGAGEEVRRDEAATVDQNQPGDPLGEADGEPRSGTPDERRGPKRQRLCEVLQDAGEKPCPRLEGRRGVSLIPRARAGPRRSRDAARPGLG